MPEPLKTVLIGATGLVGAQLLRQLLDHPRTATVTVLGRRHTGVVHAKLREHVVDFERPDAWADLVKGDALFSALGTTLKQAGGKDAQYRVDYAYQYWTAQAAAKNGVPAYALVSSAGSSASSRLFYSRMKGELERDVKALGFRKTVIVQPGMLAGDRREKRTGEEVAYAVLKHLPKWKSLSALRPYPADVVARATIHATLSDSAGVEVLSLGSIFEKAAT